MRRVAIRSLALLGIFILFAAGPYQASGQEGDAPGKPTGLTGTAAYDSVTLTWDDPNDASITGYQILRRQRGVHNVGDFQVHVDDTGSAAATWTDTDVEAGKRYVYRVKARNGAGLSERSSYFDADLPSAPVPARPTGLTGTVSHDSVTLTWDDPGDETITSYQVLRRAPAIHDPDEFVVLMDDTGSPATQYTDDTVQAGTSYVYRVKARNSFGLGEQSSYFDADVPQPPVVTVTDNDEPDTVVADDNATRDGATSLGDITDVTVPKFSKYTINGDDDKVDYYRFTLTEPRKVELALRQLDFNADLLLEDGRGVTIKQSLKSGTTNEWVDGIFSEGTYYIRVEAKEQGENEYVLRYGVKDAPDASDDAKHSSASLKSSHDSEKAIIITHSAHGVIDSLGLVEGADGKTVTYEVSLASAPTAEVTVTITHTPNEGLSIGTEGSVDTIAPLTFTTTNWATGQAVLITHVQEGQQEGEEDNTDHEVVIVTHTANGGGYDDVTADLTVNLIDNSGGYLTVSKETLTVVEGDSSGGTVSIVTSETTSGLTITITGMEGSSLQVYPSTASFGPAEDSIAGALTMTVRFSEPPDQDTDDERVTLKVTASGGEFEGTPPRYITIYMDDLGATPPRGVYVSPVSIQADEGAPITYSVALTSQPTGDVTVTGTPPLRWRVLGVGPVTVTFTPANWITLQTITTHSVDTPGTGDDYTATIANVAAGADYGSNSVGAHNVTVSIRDNAYSEGLLEVSDHVLAEDGGSLEATVTLVWWSEHPPVRAHPFVLSSAIYPGQWTHTSNVTPIYQELLPESTFRDRTFFIDQMVFYPRDYTRAEGEPARYTASLTRRIRAFDDDIYELNEDFGVRLSSASGWTIPNVGVSLGSTGGIWHRVAVIDDDPSGITITPNEIEVTEEDADGVTYRLEMVSEPAEDVYIDIGLPEDSDLTVVPTTVTFTPDDWDTPKEVTITAAADDDTVDDRVVLTHKARSPEVERYKARRKLYDSHVLPDVTVRVRENDKGVNLSARTLDVQEGDSDGATYSVWLNTRPTDTVTVTIAGHSGTDLTLDKTSLTFTQGNWNTRQDVKVTAATDADGDDDMATLTHTSSGGDYSSLTPSNLSVTVKERRGVIVEPTTLTVLEGDTVGATYGVKLEFPPSGNVTIDITRTGSDDVTAQPTNLTFTTSNWNVEQDVTVTTQVNHSAIGGAATLAHSASGGGYDDVAIDDVEVTVQEINVVGVVLSPTGRTIDEGESGEYYVTLSDPPTTGKTVTVTITGAQGTDVSVTPSSLTFDGDDWNVRQTVTVNTSHDVDDEDDIVVLANTASGGGYDIVAPARFTVTVRDDDIPSVAVSPLTLDIDEGHSDTYTLVLKAQPTDDVTVTINRVGSSDVSVDDDSLVFTSSNWDTEQTVTVRTLHDPDHLDDDTATLEHTVTSSDIDYNGIDVDDVNVTVTDDDDKPVTVEFEQTTYNVTEGSDVTIKVVLSAPPERQVIIPITRTEDGATSADYSNVPANVTFGENDREKTFTFSAIQDTIDDDDEKVKLSFGSLPNAVTAGTDDEATVNITDDDHPEITVSYEHSTYNVPEGNSVAIKVVLSAAPKRPVDISITKSEEDGATSLDYIGVPASLTFGENDTEKTFTFTANDDDINDDGEKVKLGFGSSLPARITEGTTGEATANIIDDDGAGVSVSPAALTIGEGSSGAYKVRLSSQPTASVTVTVTAPLNTDIEVNKTTLTFTTSNWDTDQTVTVRTLHDSDHLDDTGSVTHSASSTDSDYNGISISAVSVTVTDDEDTPVTVEFEQTMYIATEGSDVTIKVTLSEKPERQVIIPITKTEEDGATSADYSNVPANVTFGENDTEKTFTFSVTQDTIDDDDEKVKLGFGMLPNAVTAGTDDEATVNITDDDDPFVTVRFGQPSHIVPESDDSTTTDDQENEIEVKVILNADPERTVVIPITTTGQDGATSPDYSGVPANVTFNTGEMEKSFTFTAEHDTVDDDDESVKLAFGALPHRVNRENPSMTVISITDDDDPEVKVSFSDTSYEVPEGGTVIVTVKLDEDPERTVTIPLIRTNQAGATDQDDTGADYSGIPASVTFHTGEKEKSFTFTAEDDTVDDDDESVQIAFGTLPERVSEGADEWAVINILDNDFPFVTVEFDRETFTVPEGREVELKVTLSADPERAVTIPITTAHLDGATNEDYSLPTSVTFQPGETEKSFRFRAEHDQVDDDNERVRMEFGTLPTRMSRVNPESSTAWLVDARFASITPTGGGDECPMHWSLGSWTDGENLYVVHYSQTTQTNRIRSFSIETGVMVTDFDTGVESDYDLTGLWSDGTTIWVAVYGQNIRAYVDGTRDESKDFELASDNEHPMGMVVVDGILWVGDILDDKVYAYDWETQQRLPDRDFPQTEQRTALFDHYGGSIVGIWTDGDTLWFADSLDRILYAYNLEDGARRPNLDVTLYPENQSPMGITSDGTTMFVIDQADCMVYRYGVPGK